MVVLFVLELLTILALGMLSNSPVAKAQFAGSLPACARLCATTAANAVGCKSDLTDASCLCASKFFSNATLTCSSSSCPSADQTTMTAYLEDMCKSATKTTDPVPGSLGNSTSIATLFTGSGTTSDFNATITTSTRTSAPSTSARTSALQTAVGITTSSTSISWATAPPSIISATNSGNTNSTTVVVHTVMPPLSSSSAPGLACGRTGAIALAMELGMTWLVMFW
ncbi:hypothetical protein L208DRAFT_1459244 [Tricholoma matsutake]|nr:hypothetical protein L208DRAFT_1459244 [Tricholoma matsutake 945]